MCNKLYLQVYNFEAISKERIARAIVFHCIHRFLSESAHAMRLSTATITFIVCRENHFMGVRRKTDINYSPPTRLC